MTTELQQGLLITAIGMGLVFAVIIFLWGVMALLMRLTSGDKSKKRKPKPSKPLKSTTTKIEDPLIPQMVAVEKQRRAVAVATAVSIALTSAQSHPSQKRREDESTNLNPWQVFHRLRQLEDKKTRG